MTDRTALCERVIDALGDAVFPLDTEGVIRLWNPGTEELFGHPASATEGRTVDTILQERFRDRHWAGWREAMETGDTKYGRRQVLKTPVERADGSGGRPRERRATAGRRVTGDWRMIAPGQRI